MIRYLTPLFLLVLSTSVYALSDCGDDYDKCLALLKIAEKTVEKNPYDENKSYPDDYPANNMYLYSGIIDNFAKKVPLKFKTNDKNLALAVRAYVFYNKIQGHNDFFSIAPFKRLWCHTGKKDTSKILRAVDNILRKDQKLKKLFREAIRECGSCKTPNMCEHSEE